MNPSDTSTSDSYLDGASEYEANERDLRVDTTRVLSVRLAHHSRKVGPDEYARDGHRIYDEQLYQGDIL